MKWGLAYRIASALTSAALIAACTVDTQGSGSGNGVSGGSGGGGSCQSPRDCFEACACASATKEQCASVCGASGGAGNGGFGGTAGSGFGGFGGGAGGALGSGGSAGGTGWHGPNPTPDSAATPGPFSVQSYASGFADSPAYLGATIYYPGNADPPFAGVAVAPGFTEAQTALSGWGQFLASHAFVVLTLDTNTGFDQPQQRADALMAAVETLTQENQRAGSPVAGKIDTTRFVIMGHSMGGGGTLIASNANSNRLKAAVPLTPWSSSPTTFPSISVPTLIVAGQNDGFADANQHAFPFYQSIPSTTKKAYIEFAGGDHFVANNPSAGTPAAKVVARQGLSFIKLFADGDTRYRPFLQQDPAFSRYQSTL